MHRTPTRQQSPDNPTRDKSLTIRTKYLMTQLLLSLISDHGFKHPVTSGWIEDD